MPIVVLPWIYSVHAWWCSYAPVTAADRKFIFLDSIACRVDMQGHTQTNKVTKVYAELVLHTCKMVLV